MANALTGNFGPLAALDYVQQQGEIGRQRGQQNRLNMLTGQAYSATTPQDRSSLLGQMAQISPQAAQAQQQQFQSQEDRNRTLVYNAARYLKGALDRQNPAEIAGAWRAVRPGLINAGLATEQELSPDWQPDYAQTVHQALAMGDGGTGQGVQSTYVDDQGQRVAILRDGSTRVLGGNDAGSNQQTLTIDINGTPTQVTFDRRTGRYTNANLGSSQGPAMQMLPQGGGQRIIEQDAALANQMIAAGIPPEQVDAVIAQRASQASGTQQSWNQGQLAQGTPLVGRRKEDEAAAVEAARQAVQQQYLPQELAARTQASLAQEAGQSQVKAQAEQAAKARSNANAARVYEEGMGGAIKALSGASTGPLVGLLPAMTTDQQIAEGGVSAMAPVMKEMFRTAGEGTFTDKDQDLLMAMLPTRRDSPEAREAKAANVDNIVRAKLNIGPPQKATNPKTGETLYLRFGQWVKK